MKKRLLVAGLLLASSGFYALSSDSLHTAAYHGNHAKVVQLLQQQPDVDARDSFGGTALHAAMFQSNLEIVQLLLDAGFEVNAIGPANGYTPAHDAVWADNLPALKLLVANGADLTIKGHDGQTPLAKAESERKASIVAYLSSLPNR